ncbi:MAG: hypothetical protein ACKOA8_13265 [Deltaproteobacteria bacterium]
MTRFFVWGVWVICFSGIAKEVATPRRHALADVYCTVLFESKSDPEKYQQAKDIWSGIEKHMIEGRLYSLLSDPSQAEIQFEKIQSTPIFKKCVEENQPEFELGEFVLAGKKIVNEALRVAPSKSQTDLSTASLTFDNSIDELSDLKVEVRTNFAAPENSRVLEAIALREKKYSELWGRFMKSIKDKSKGLSF